MHNASYMKYYNKKLKLISKNNTYLALYYQVIGDFQESKYYINGHFTKTYHNICGAAIATLRSKIHQNYIKLILRSYGYPLLYTRNQSEINKDRLRFTIYKDYTYLTVFFRSLSFRFQGFIFAISFFRWINGMSNIFSGFALVWIQIINLWISSHALS